MTDHAPVTQETGEEPKPTQSPVRRKRASVTSPEARLIPPDLTREEAVRRLAIFYRLARLIPPSTNEPDRIAQAVAHLVSEMVGDMCTVALLNPRGDTYRIAAWFDPDPDAVAGFTRIMTETANLPTERGWISYSLRTGQPLRIEHFTAEQLAESATPAFAEFSRQVGLSSLLVVPILGESGLLGSIALTRHHDGRAYTLADENLLVELGHRVGSAIETASLVTSLREDLSARLFAREALAASEERFLSIFHASPFGIKVMDLVGTLLESNRAFQSITGYDEEQLIALRYYDLVYPEDVAPLRDLFTQIKTRKRPSGVLEHRIIRRDGAIAWVRTTFAAVRRSPSDESLSLIFGIVEDVTARREAEDRLRELQLHLQHAIEIERLRLAQNLHDVPLQELYAAIYKLEDLRPKVGPENAESLGGVIDDIKQTLNGLRSASNELRPPAIRRFGLEKAIRSYAGDFSLKHPELQLKLTLARDAQLLTEETRLVLFRVFQEALANVVRHARATCVDVHFSFDAEQARIDITDDGAGFAVPENWLEKTRTGHYGLAGLVERVTAAGGTLTIDSQPGGPTTVRALVPC